MSDMDLLDEEIEEFQRGEVIRGKWIMDGARNLTEAARMLRAVAQRLEEMEALGWQLTEPVADDYGFLQRGAVE